MTLHVFEPGMAEPDAVWPGAPISPFPLPSMTVRAPLGDGRSVPLLCIDQYRVIDHITMDEVDPAVLLNRVHRQGAAHGILAPHTVHRPAGPDTTPSAIANLQLRGVVYPMVYPAHLKHSNPLLWHEPDQPAFWTIKHLCTSNGRFGAWTGGIMSDDGSGREVWTFNLQHATVDVEVGGRYKEGDNGSVGVHELGITEVIVYVPGAALLLHRALGKENRRAFREGLRTMAHELRLSGVEPNIKDIAYIGQREFEDGPHYDTGAVMVPLHFDDPGAPFNAPRLWQATDPVDYQVLQTLFAGNGRMVETIRAYRKADMLTAGYYLPVPRWLKSMYTGPDAEPGDFI